MSLLTRSLLPCLVLISQAPALTAFGQYDDEPAPSYEPSNEPLYEPSYEPAYEPSYESSSEPGSDSDQNSIVADDVSVPGQISGIVLECALACAAYGAATQIPEAKWPPRLKECMSVCGPVGIHVKYFAFCQILWDTCIATLGGPTKRNLETCTTVWNHVVKIRKCSGSAFMESNDYGTCLINDVQQGDMPESYCTNGTWIRTTTHPGEVPAGNGTAAGDGNSNAGNSNDGNSFQNSNPGDSAMLDALMATGLSAEGAASFIAQGADPYAYLAAHYAAARFRDSFGVVGNDGSSSDADPGAAAADQAYDDANTGSTATDYNDNGDDDDVDLAAFLQQMQEAAAQAAEAAAQQDPTLPAMFHICASQQVAFGNCSICFQYVTNAAQYEAGKALCTMLVESMYHSGNDSFYSGSGYSDYSGGGYSGNGYDVDNSYDSYYSSSYDSPSDTSYSYSDE